MPAIPGNQYTYDPAHGTGLGHNAAGNPLTAEMSELDLVPGTTVEVLELDADSDWPLVQWTDGTGINRITTIEPNVFDQDFAPV
jgi:hypothetical protein